MPGRTRGKDTPSTEDTQPETFAGQVSEEELAASTVDSAAVALSIRYDANALRGLDSFDAALALAGETFGSLDDAAHTLGDGFALLRTDGAKANLVGRPLILMEWAFYPGDFGDEFAAIRVVAQEKNGSISKFIVNDGSTGVAKMLRDYTNNTGRRGGLVVRNGFRASDYLYCEDCGTAKDITDAHKTFAGYADHRVGKATTYYIDTSL